jgi:hypothetical protein
MVLALGAGMGMGAQAQQSSWGCPPCPDCPAPEHFAITLSAQPTGVRPLETTAWGVADTATITALVTKAGSPMPYQIVLFSVREANGRAVSTSRSPR